MPNTAVIRPETPADAAAIHAIHRAAFGRADEARLVDALRDARVTIASLLALDGRHTVGHALFSTVWIDSDGPPVAIASLAPVAVVPEWQRRGIGTALIRAGLESCRAAGSAAVIVVGHPAYYPRFGFAAGAVAHLDSPYAGEAFMGLDLLPGFLASIRGHVRYPEAFASL
jgi:putative acetyltransferase